MNIGNNIKKYRKLANITQKQLAEKIGMSANSIQRYESGSREPNIGTINKIATALDVPVSRLLEEDTINLTDSEKLEVNKDVDKLLDIVNILNTVGIDRLIAYAEDLKEIPKYIKEGE